MKNKILILLFALSLSLFAFSANAQVQGSDILLNIKPVYPAPGDNVTTTLSSYSTDLNKSNISWSINGQQKISAIGQKSFSFSVSDLTSTINIEAHINTVDGQDIFKRAIITPTEVDMLWQGTSSFTPPFYRGRSFVPSEGSFKVVAMPNIHTPTGNADAKNLSYAWKKDDSAQQSASGFGKNYLTFKNNYLDSENNIQVSVSDLVGNNKANGTIKLTTKKPQIIFYKNDPDMGIDFAHGITNSFDLNKNPASLIAVPYFLSPKNINSTALDFTWYINNEKISTPSPKNTITIKPNANETGTASIKLNIDNTNSLFGNISKQINVNL